MAVKRACTHPDCTEEGIFTIEDGEHLCMQHIHEQNSVAAKRTPSESPCPPRPSAAGWWRSQVVPLLRKSQPRPPRGSGLRGKPRLELGTRWRDLMVGCVGLRKHLVTRNMVDGRLTYAASLSGCLTSSLSASAKIRYARAKISCHSRCSGSRSRLARSSHRAALAR